ncbi:hypothetical protein L1887_05547 [Cichorium endivia]|nr:hypothetical protein L1887_05547 [Cichorium endivia]
MRVFFSIGLSSSTANSYHQAPPLSRSRLNPMKICSLFSNLDRRSASEPTETFTDVNANDTSETRITTVNSLGIHVLETLNASFITTKFPVSTGGTLFGPIEFCAKVSQTLRIHCNPNLLNPRLASLLWQFFDCKTSTAKITIKARHGMIPVALEKFCVFLEVIYSCRCLSLLVHWHSYRRNFTSRIKVKLKANNVDICYPLIFQSGGNFNLKPSASSNDDHLYHESASVIVCALGSSYNSHCVNVARTFLIDSNARQGIAYQIFFKAHEVAVTDLKTRNKANVFYKAVVDKEAPEMVANLTKSFGTGIGLEFCEFGMSLNEKNEKILKVGMVFNVSLWVQN